MDTIRNIYVEEMSPEKAAGSIVIAVANAKGGCGKSTTAMQIANYWARRGKNVLVVDFDIQTNLTQRLGLKDSDRKMKRLDEFFSMIGRDEAVPDDLWGFPCECDTNIYRAKDGNGGYVCVRVGTIGLLPGQRLAGGEAKQTYERMLEDSYNHAGAPNLHHAFRNLIQAQKRYWDIIVIDTAPALESNVLNSLAVFAADAILVPIDGVEAAWGLKNFLNWIRKQIQTNDLSPMGARLPLPQVICAMTKYMADTRRSSASSELKIRNKVFQVLKANLKDYILDHGVRDSIVVKRDVCGRAVIREYDAMIAELFANLTAPQMNIYSFLTEQSYKNLERDLSALGEEKGSRRADFRSIVYRKTKKPERAPPAAEAIQAGDKPTRVIGSEANEMVHKYLLDHPEAIGTEIAKALCISYDTLKNTPSWKNRTAYRGE